MEAKMFCFNARKRQKVQDVLSKEFAEKTTKLQTGWIYYYL